MSSGYIVFSYANFKFLVPLEQFHIILNPDEIIDKIGYQEDQIDDIFFGNKLINIFHLSKYLNAESRKINNSSRLLVGEFHGRFIGFWVDKINEIINIGNISSDPENLIEENLFVKKRIHEGQEYNMINLNKIIADEIKVDISDD